MQPIEAYMLVAQTAVVDLCTAALCDLGGGGGGAGQEEKLRCFWLQPVGY